MRSLAMSALPPKADIRSARRGPSIFLRPRRPSGRVGAEKMLRPARFDLWAVLLANNLRGVLANSGDSAHHSEEGTFRKAHLCLCALECAFGVGDRS